MVRVELVCLAKERAVEQFNGCEGETATLLWTSLVKFKVVAGGFALCHLRRYILIKNFVPKGKM